MDYIWSTDGNVFVSAPDGIFAKDNNSFIIGNQVELYAKEGMIGTSANPIFIDSDVHGAPGDGGVLAWAMGDIHIREMEGDLFLAEQLNLAAGFDEENAEASQDNLKSTYDEIRPLEDGAANEFRGSIHSTQGSVNIEVVGGSVIDNIAEGFVALTPEQILARNERLGLGGAAGEAAALADLDADATAKTEAYHRYWKDFRHAMRAATPIAADTLAVTGVDTGTDTLNISAGMGASAFETGDEVVIGGSVSDTDLANAGLTRGASYYVIKLDDTHIQLATTRANAAITPTPTRLNITGLASLTDLELLRFDYAEAAFTPNQVPSTVPHDFTTASTPASVVTNQIVELAADIDGGAEGRFGQKFIYVGTATLVAPDLGSIDYVSSPDWDLVVDPVYGAQQEVENAYESGDTRFGDPDEYDAGFVFTYTQAEKDAYVAANTFDLDALENPVSPGLMQALYPHAEFGSTVVNADSTESVNITADEVNIVAGTKTAGPVRQHRQQVGHHHHQRSGEFRGAVGRRQDRHGECIARRHRRRALQDLPLHRWRRDRCRPGGRGLHVVRGRKSSPTSSPAPTRPTRSTGAWRSTRPYSCSSIRRATACIARPRTSPTSTSQTRRSISAAAGSA